MEKRSKGIEMSMSDRDGKIWMDGRLIAWREANVHILTHSLHYGLAVFEGIRAYQTPRGPAIFRLKEHIRRLFGSAKILQLEIPFDAATIEAAQVEVVRVNDLAAGYIRPLVWVGSEALSIGATGNTIHVATAAYAMGSYLGEEGMERGIRVKTSSFTRHHVNAALVRAKASGYYINSILAHREAASVGYDEALLLDTEGYVSEGAGENVFLVRDGVIFTPDLASCLDGITRDAVLTIARDHGIELREKRITRDEFYCADEAFFTGTAAEITPIRTLDDRVIGNGRRGPVTERIQETFFAAARGTDARYQRWLTPVHSPPH
jgi:branched-chain amino acid aminotransferase